MRQFTRGVLELLGCGLILGTVILNLRESEGLVVASLSGASDGRASLGLVEVVELKAEVVLLFEVLFHDVVAFSGTALAN